VCQPVRQLSIVGEQDQAGRLGIETTNWIEARCRVYEFDYGRSTPGFPSGRHHPSRLVHRPYLPGLGPNQAPIHPDLISICDIARRVGDDFPADPDSTFGDDHLSFTPGGNSSMREELGEPHVSRTG
jgi:hypothetical protein